MPRALIPRNAKEWAAQISAHWHASVKEILATGHTLIMARKRLSADSFDAMLENALPFGARTAQRLMVIAADQRIGTAARASLLPANWTILYELTQLDDDTFQTTIEDGTINADMERKAVRNLNIGIRRDMRLEQMRELADNPLQLPRGPFAAGVADPPWEDPDSLIGFSDRHYRNKYPTMAPAQIAAMPVRNIFAPTAFLALWITRHIVAIGGHIPVLESWGFNPNTLVTWDKEWIGLGNGYVRDRTEHLVFATRGKVAVPTDPQMRPDSLFSIRRTPKHSEKPDWPQRQIELWFPNMSYVELFARSKRPNWVAWGNEAPAQQERIRG